MFTTLDELNGTLKRRPTGGYGGLRLDHYLVLQADDEETDEFITRLEDDGHLPLTVAWFSQEGHKTRLYQRVKGISTDGVLLLGLSMSVLTGADTMCLVASPSNRLRDYYDLNDESLLENRPAALNEKGLMILQSLLLLSDAMMCEDCQS
jgi:hypothetical protein